VAHGGLIDAKPVSGLGDASGRPDGIQRHQQIEIDFRKPSVVDFKLHASHLSWPAATVVARMKEMPVTGTLFGPAIVRRDGRMVHDMYLVEVKKPGESRSDWDSYKVLLNVPGNEAFRPMSPSCSLVSEGK
jgi:hypothetical protein